jgi:hypothetical protein
MSRLEIIHLRTSGEPLTSLGERIWDSLEAVVDKADLVTLYRREDLETDVAVHIQHRKTPGGKGPSDLGLHLASALRAYGLVEHTLWTELP